jgi:large subunit ribosomal protein L23
MRIHDVIRRPLITEKTTRQREVANTYAFAVAVAANKIEIRRAVETQFKVKVAEVRISRQRGKLRRQGRYAGRQADWKKAYVRLVEGEKQIEFFEGA